MTRLTLALIIAVASVGVAEAASGDFKVINGAIVDPQSLAPTDSFVAVRADDGTTYYADLHSARARTRTLKAGDRVSVVGYETTDPRMVNVLVLESAGVAAAGDLVTQGDFRVPQSHKYETYDFGKGIYLPIEVTSIASRVGIKQPIYDRTAEKWVYNPALFPASGGRNPEYLASAAPGTSTTASAPAPAGAQGAWQRIHGTVVKQEGPVLTFRADDGRTLTVDTASVGSNVQRALTPNEGATLIGFAGAQPNQFVARYIQQDSSDASRGGTVVGKAASTPAQGWQRIHGTVQSVSGNTVTVKADDGRTLTVDASQVGAAIRGALKPGEGVTLIGMAGGSASQFTARYIQQDSSNTARGGQVTGQATAPPAPSTPVDEKSWQRIHGSVVSVSGTTVTVKADDGRTLTVDAREVSEGVRKALTPGEKVTVIGFYRGNQNTVAARYIQQDSSAASPSTAPKKK